MTSRKAVTAGRALEWYCPLASDAPAGLLVKPDRALRQIDEEEPPAWTGTDVKAGRPPDTGGGNADTGTGTAVQDRAEPPRPKRFHGTVALSPERAGRDAGRMADAVLSHLVGLVGADVTVTLEIEAQVPGGVPGQVVRTATENCRALKFKSRDFEAE
jgi:hypothetical protein